MTEQTEVAVIGSGMAGLTVACLLAKQHIPVRVLEQNWLPGGCSSSYPRKHYIFESGATTLVGLDPGMPLHHLLQETGISLAARKLEVPMKVYLKNGAVLTRHQNLDAWIAEAERVFGPEGQRPFWEYCSRISQFVWDTSLQQRAFPPSSAGDLFHAALHFRPRQIGFAALAFRSVKDLLADFGLLQNRDFVEFVDEQLLITAQNHHAEVNVLFGATALCYTQSGNYYMPGGLINLVQPLVNYISDQGGSVELRRGVTRIEETEGGYLLHSQKHTL
ncbi:MAG: amine oxidase, partial [Bacteroidetes bacterium]